MKKILIALSAMIVITSCKPSPKEDAELNLNIITLTKPRFDSLYTVLEKSNDKYAYAMLDGLYNQNTASSVIPYDTIKNAIIYDSAKGKLYEDANGTTLVLVSTKLDFLKNVMLVDDTARDRLLSVYRKIIPPFEKVYDSLIDNAIQGIDTTKR